jgi:hypothetical protein
MIRYKIIHTDLVCDGMSYNDALVTAEQLRHTYPDIEYEVVEYDYIPSEYKRLGRDPDLH